jgi:beta-glucosidase
LQGFVKDEIGANELKKLEIKLGPRNFSYWSVDTNTWQIKGGTYKIFIGSSSENIHLEASISLEQAFEVL